MRTFVCYLLIFSVSCFPIEDLNYQKISSTKALDFMKRFGYLEADDSISSALYTEHGISEAVKLVQKFGGIPETGLLDNATLKLMNSPRCGVPDVIKRTKRHAFGSEGWKKRRITYFVANWSPYLGETIVAKNIQKALDVWGRYGRLSFQRVGSPDADIIVMFGRGYHGDNFPFDGSGNILAHAFFPQEHSRLGGDIHFDDEEVWADLRKDESAEGTDFFTVALHELGHSLGLAHSTVVNSVMFPYYKGYDPDNKILLDYDDILGMYELYIRRNVETAERQETTSPPTTETTPKIVTYEGDDESVDDHKKHDKKHTIPSTNSPTFPDICNGYFDAVATLRDELFIFKDLYIWRLKEKGRIESGYPIPLHQMFPKLPKTVKNIDAAYQRPDGMIILFTGPHFWVYDGQNFIENSPRPLTDYGLPPNLSGIDAVQIWGKNKKTYFYQNDRFWRYNETIKQMDNNYPIHIEKWRGIPEKIDAATTWKDGYTYFFKEELYWKFDNDWVIITDNSPLPSPQVWLGCPEDPQKMRRFYT